MKGVSHDQPRVIEEELNRLFSPDWLRQTAKETGFVRRERKIDPALMFWVLALGFGVQLQRTLASLRRLYEEKGEVHISWSGFYDRFTPELVRFIHACVLHGLEDITQEPNRRLKEKLAGFKDIVTQDSTIIRLHKNLAKKWPATRSKRVAAGVKVSLLVSAVADGPKRVALCGERTSEIKTLRIGPWIKDRILLIDLGFYKHHTFARIDENGGYFVSRLKERIDPLIIGTNRKWPGRSKNIVGEKLSEVLPKLKRQVLDVDVEIEFNRRKYNGQQRKDSKKFRLVAIYNEEDKKYHTYITNIPVERLDAEDVAVLYSARWEIELIFKELKSRYAIDVIPTSKPEIVEALIWIGILTLIISRRVYSIVYSSNLENAPRYTHLRWATVFAEKSHRLLDAVLDYADIEATLMELFEVYQSQALDPNVNRKRLMDTWRA
jgi:putative transposase